MKVLFAIAHLDKGGGQAVQTLQLVRGLRSRVDGELLALTASQGDAPVEPGVEIVGPLRYPSGLLRLRRAIALRRRQVDLVHVFDPYFALPAARLARAHPLVVRLGAHPVEDLASRYGAPARIAQALWNPWLYSGTHVVVNADHLRAAFPGRPVTCIPNGVDTTRFAFPRDPARARLSLGLPPNVPVAVFTGKIIPRKQVEDLYWLAREVPDLHLLLVGTDREPYYGDRYHREVRAEFSDVLTRVHTVGEVAMDRIPVHLEAADIFVFPSRLEGMPNSMLEAMAAGLPVVASDSAAHREVLGDGTPFLYRDRAQLAGRVRELVADPRQAEATGLQNRHRVQTQFSLEAAVRSYLALYESILDQGG